LPSDLLSTSSGYIHLLSLFALRSRRMGNGFNPDDYLDYAEEAARLTTAVLAVAEAATTLSERRAAARVLLDAAAMHTRAAGSLQAAGGDGGEHNKIKGSLCAQARAMQRPK